MVGAAPFLFTIYEFTMYDLCTIERKFNHFPEYQGHKVIYDVRFCEIRTISPIRQMSLISLISPIGPMRQISPIVTNHLVARYVSSREGRQNHILITY